MERRMLRTERAITGKQIDKQTTGSTNRRTDGREDSAWHIYTGKWTVVYALTMERRTEGQTDGRTNARTH